MTPLFYHLALIIGAWFVLSFVAGSLIGRALKRLLGDDGPRQFYPCETSNVRDTKKVS